MEPKNYLYRRPAHSNVQTYQKDPKTGTLIDQGIQKVAAYTGLIEALKSTSMQGAHLVDSIRLIKKFTTALERPTADLCDEYIVVTEKEKELLVAAVNNFNWSKFAEASGNSVWINWLAFLAGFNSEFEEEYSFTWTVYDPLNPPVAYAEWKQAHQAALAEYASKVAAAEKAAIEANAKQTATAEASLEPAIEPAMEATQEPETSSTSEA